MDEYIERKAALAALCYDCSEKEFCKHEGKCADYIRLEETPAADVRPVVRGKWISVYDNETTVPIKDGTPQGCCYCSVCGDWLVASDEYEVRGNFCPNCGAKMEES